MLKWEKAKINRSNDSKMKTIFRRVVLGKKYILPKMLPIGNILVKLLPTEGFRQQNNLT